MVQYRFCLSEEAESRGIIALQVRLPLCDSPLQGAMGGGKKQWWRIMHERD